VIDHSKYLRKIMNWMARGRIAVVDPGITLDALNAELRPQGTLVSGRRLDERASDARRHGRQQFVRLALDRVRQHGAQRARDRGADRDRASAGRFGPMNDARGPPGYIRAGC
jgi:hypothetical protein